MYTKIDCTTALKYSDKVSETSNFYTIQENNKVLYLFEEKSNSQLQVYPQNENIAQCIDGSLLIPLDQYFQHEAERRLSKMKLDLGSVSLEVTYKKLFADWRDVFDRLLMEVDFHWLVTNADVEYLTSLLERENVEIPTNIDVLGLCNYVSSIVLREEFNLHLEDTEDFVFLDEDFNL